MKKTTKAFTLVEMLIVIVIIGILIASLMPRMQSAQGRARDVARKNDLSQIQTAIITSQQDRGAFPGMGSSSKNPWKSAGATSNNEADATKWISIALIGDNLQKAGMSSIPSDPNKSNKVFGLWEAISEGTAPEKWNYLYLVASRNSVPNAWFVLMARTEVEWSSNFVTCNVANEENRNLAHWYITTNDDLSQVKTCETVTKVDSEDSCWWCNYYDNWELRYILMY